MQNEMITIENTEMQIKEYNGQRVVTFKDIDAVHQRPAGTARKSFNRNKKHFIEGEDFMKVCVSEIRSHKLFDISNKAKADITLITESGYLLLVKSFTDDLSWKVQRQLVNAYFNVREVHKEPYYKEPIAEDFTPRVAMLENWFTRNRTRIDYIQHNLGAGERYIGIQIYAKFMRLFDIRQKREEYRKEVGEYPIFINDFISFFPELAQAADEYLDDLERLIYL